MQGLLGQVQTAPQTPPQIPKMQNPNTGFLLGEALSAIIAPQTLPFVGAALSYDQGEREKDYARKYQSAMDSWRARADSMAASNAGLMQKAEVLKSIAALPASLAVDRTVPIPKITDKMTPYEQDREMSEYYAKIASARLAAGATPQQIKESTDLASTYRQQEAQDRMIAIQEGKMPAPPGTVLPDGTVVTPNSAAALLWATGQAKLQFEQARTAFEKGAAARATDALKLRAQQIANTAGFHADEINARYALSETPQERLTIALLGLENGNAKQTSQQTWQLGKDLYDKQMAQYKAYTDAQAKGQDTSGFQQTTPPTAPPAPQSLDITVHSVQDAANAANQVLHPKPGPNTGVIPPPPNPLDVAMSTPAFNSLDGQTKAAVVNAKAKGFDLPRMRRMLAAVASGQTKSAYITPQGAAAALHALSGTK